MQRVGTGVQAVEERMDKLVGEEEMAETRLGIGMESMVRMVRGAASKLNALQHCMAELRLHNSGGYGSNGADGAAAGNVFVTVHEEDTDLLVPLEYDVRGGAGGASGQHGEPGDGGVGGRGGAPHAW
jgi:hypothetical protein